MTKKNQALQLRIQALKRNHDAAIRQMQGSHKDASRRLQEEVDLRDFTILEMEDRLEEMRRRMNRLEEELVYYRRSNPQMPQYQTRF